MSPPCETYLTAEQLDGPETFYPLHVRICDRCLLVQLPPYLPAEDIFSDYAYFSSYSDSWVRHAKTFVDDMVERLTLGPSSFVVEVASNDGYLLQEVVRRGIPCLGVEPAANVAAAAQERGVPTMVAFLGEETGRKVAQVHGPADLVVGNNVFAHVPDLLDFARGLRELVADRGVVSLEFPHLLRLIEGRQFDTIYHEHYSYFTLGTATAALATAGLAVFDVVELASHGGSLRVLSSPRESAPEPSARVAEVRAAEAAAGLDTVEGHLGFAPSVLRVRTDLVDLLTSASLRGPQGRRLRRTGQGEHAAQPLRDPPRPAAVHGRPQHLQAGPVPAGHAHPDPRARAARAGTARADRDPAVEPRRPRSSAQLSYAREWGAAFVVPIPELTIL